MFKTIAIVLMAVAIVLANPEPKADPKAKADPGVLAYSAYSAPLVSSYVPAAVVERSYHGNGFAYPYVSAPIVASAPYTAAYAAPLYFR